MGVKIPVAEAGPEGLKRHVQDRLQWLQNQGKLWAIRLNAGATLIKTPEKRYMIRNAPAGTADFLILIPVWRLLNIDSDTGQMVARVVFLETKSTDGVQSDAQIEFQRQVESIGWEYRVVKTPEELEEII